MGKIDDYMSRDYILLGDSEFTKKDHDELMNSMLSFAESDKPQVGIFWLDVTDSDLFGVHTEDFDKIQPDKNGRVIYPKLHYQVWNKDKYKAIAKKDIQLANKFKGDYTKVHRGRVNYENGKFLVYVGNWIPKYKDMLSALICAYFNLDPDQFKFVVDEHWNLNHGFSGDKFMN